jgi:hypothetical protein
MMLQVAYLSAILAEMGGITFALERHWSKIESLP